MEPVSRKRSKTPERSDQTPPPKRGRPVLSSAEKQDDALYRAGCRVLEQFSPKSVFRAATLAARRAKNPNSAYIFHKLENDTENQASLLREAEAQSLKPSKFPMFDHCSRSKITLFKNYSNCPI